MKTTNFRTVEELNLDVNAPAVTPTKVQNDKIVRALKKLSVTDPDETVIIKMVSAFVALGVNPQAKSSSWLARRLKNHLEAFGLVGATAPVAANGPVEVGVQEPAEVTFKSRQPSNRSRRSNLKPRLPRKLRRKSNTRNECRNSGCHFARAFVLYPRYETAPAVLNATNEASFNCRSSLPHRLVSVADRTSAKLRPRLYCR
jgi:hypothetical protein